MRESVLADQMLVICNADAMRMQCGCNADAESMLVCLQEMPEKAPAGQLPRSVDIVADNDLCDKCKVLNHLHFLNVFSKLHRHELVILSQYCSKICIYKLKRFLTPQHVQLHVFKSMYFIKKILH